MFHGHAEITGNTVVLPTCLSSILGGFLVIKAMAHPCIEAGRTISSY
jgi:hypothetical protein